MALLEVSDIHTRYGAIEAHEGRLADRRPAPACC